MDTKEWNEWAAREKYLQEREEYFESRKHYYAFLLHVTEGAVSLSLQGIKSLILINGGALAALLAYISAHNNFASGMSVALAWFLGGIVSAIMTTLFAYFTQMAIYAEMTADNGKKYNTEALRWIAIAFSMLSLIGFVVGSFSAYCEFQRMPSV